MYDTRDHRTPLVNTRKQGQERNGQKKIIETGKGRKYAKATSLKQGKEENGQKSLVRSREKKEMGKNNV